MTAGLELCCVHALVCLCSQHYSTCTCSRQQSDVNRGSGAGVLNIGRDYTNTSRHHRFSLVTTRSMKTGCSSYKRILGS